ncbi:bulb-type lectin domain-containing protein [Tanacetum coccineum]|uniref:Bulb-type lectin domain-containing protein n=1 Tax=Tanacetum coccineum TaxID=301880 RepID=A0ABQ5ISN7_9ASTR
MALEILVPEQRIVSFDLSGCDSESKSYMIEQVFIRMSVKDIVRCMIVCKSWGRFIGDPGFRRAYENMSGILITKDKSKIFSFAKNIFDILDQVPDEVDTHQVPEFDNVDTPAPRPSARVPEQRIVSFDLSGCDSESKSYIIEQIFSFAKNIFDILDQVPDEVDTHQVPEFDNVDTPAPRPSARVPEQRIVSFDLSGCDSESKSYIIEQVFIRTSMKDIVRCMIVCKSWGRFIRDPGFRRAYENMSGILITKDKLKDTKDCWFNNKWNKVAHLLGSTQEDQEAVKECYKEYIGMVKIYYEGAQRLKPGRPGEDMVGNSSGTAWIKEPQAFAKMSVEIEDTLDGTPKKKSRIARDDVNKESNEKQKQLEERLKDTKDCWFNNKWNKVAHLLGSAQGDQEAVKECYKEYIGMVKIYYEGAQRSKQGRPGEDVVGNSSGTAWIKEPQAFAKMSVEIEDTLDGTPRKKSRIARDDVNKESNEKQKQLEGLFRCRLPTISDAWRLEA